MRWRGYELSSSEYHLKKKKVRVYAGKKSVFVYNLRRPGDKVQFSDRDIMRGVKRLVRKQFVMTIFYIRDEW